MSSVKENLIAARALIDTPEKWKMRGESVVAVFRDLDEREYGDCRASLTVAAGLKYQNQLVPHLFNTTHPMVMALFDRAIAAAEVAA